jgi:hypothetical protein
MERQLLDLISQLGDDMNKSDHALLNLVEAMGKRIISLEEIVKTMLEVQKAHLELSKS